MNLLIKRRQLILATLVVVLGAAVFVNWYYGNNDTKIKPAEETTDAEYVQNLGEAKYVNAQGETADYFSEVKLNRQKSRDEALEKLNSSLEKATSGSDEAKKLTESIENLSAQIKTEGDVESLISAKLGSECVVVLGEKSAQIVVAKGSMSDDSALQITEIITSNTDLSASAVKISESE